MDDHCQYCGSGKAYPVLDKRIENSPKPGNKYRAACLGCERWLPLTSEEEFRAHPEPHVLPADAGSDELGRIVPLEEYDYGEEWAELVEQANDQQAVADGGSHVVDDDDRSEEPANRFQCPATGCEAEVEGKPPECPECGAPYQW